MTLTFDLLTSKSIGRILDSWWVSVWSFMIIGWLQSQLSSGNHFQITMRHDLDLLTPKSIGHILDSWGASVWSFMIIGGLQSQLSSGNHFQTSVTDRQTDWRTDWRTDRVQTYSPLRFHRWGTKNHFHTLAGLKTWWRHNPLLFWVFLCDKVSKRLPISTKTTCKCPIRWLYLSVIKNNSLVQVTYWTLTGK